MLVAAYIEAEHAKMMEGATPDQVELLTRECNDLMTWGERHAQDISLAEGRRITVNRVFQLEEGPRELPVEKWVQPLCEANRGLLGDVDRRILQSYRTLKTAGFKRPSIVLSCAYFRHVVTNGEQERYVENPKAWGGVALVRQRLDSTCRLAVRYEHPEKFGPKVTEKKDGGVLIEYTKEAWRSALARRGVVPRKKTGGQDAGRRSAIGGREMRQVPGAVSDKEDRQKGDSVRGKGANGVGGEFQGGKRRKGSRRVQRDMSTLSFSFADAGEEDGSGGQDQGGAGRKASKG